MSVTMGVWRVFSLYFVLSLVANVRCQDAQHIRRLHRDLIETNNPMIRPVANSSHGTVVHLQFNLVSISAFDEISQAITTNGYFQIDWVDEFLQWNASDYGGITTIAPAFQKIWRPLITLQNTVDKIEPLGLVFAVIVVTASGNVSWMPGQTFRTFCRMDVSLFPFDVQTCTYTVFEWGNHYPYIDLRVLQNSISLAMYNENSEWQITNTSASRKHITVAYENQYTLVEYHMRIKRKPSSKILTVIVPVLVLSLLNTVVFLIPVESGEKLSFSVTVLLSFAVFMSFLANMLPQNADSLSVFAIFLASLLCMSSTYVILTIWIIHMFHRDPQATPVPAWMRTTTRALERVLFCRQPTAVRDDRRSTVLSKEAWTPQPLITWKKVSQVADRTLFWLFLSVFLSITAYTLVKLTNVV